MYTQYKMLTLLFRPLYITLAQHVNNNWASVRLPHAFPPGFVDGVSRGARSRDFSRAVYRNLAYLANSKIDRIPHVIRLRGRSYGPARYSIPPVYRRCLREYRAGRRR